MSQLIRMSAIFVWSILGGFFVTYYLDTHQLLDDEKFLSISAIRDRLTLPFPEATKTTALRKIKDNWTYDVKNKRVLFVENILPEPSSSLLESILKSPVKKDQYKYIMKKLVESQLPQELALIPILESEYNTDAVSNKGAGGLWQLMPGTADDLGLTNDDRFSLEPSTDAALVYFKQLYKKFGKWEFAIAAYNAGSNRVEKAMLENPTAKSIQELNLPSETKIYVAKFYQMLALGANAPVNHATTDDN